MLSLNAGVAAFAPEFTLADDGATKVEKAVFMEATAQLAVQDLSQVEALAVEYAEAQLVTDLSVITPERVFSVLLESTAYRSCQPTLAYSNPLPGFKPPASTVPRAQKLYIRHCDIRQC